MELTSNYFNPSINYNPSWFTPANSQPMVARQTFDNVLGKVQEKNYSAPGIAVNEESTGGYLTVEELPVWLELHPDFGKSKQVVDGISQDKVVDSREEMTNTSNISLAADMIDEQESLPDKKRIVAEDALTPSTTSLVQPQKTENIATLLPKTETTILPITNTLPQENSLKRLPESVFENLPVYEGKYVSQHGFHIWKDTIEGWRELQEIWWGNREEEIQGEVNGEAKAVLSYLPKDHPITREWLQETMMGDEFLARPEIICFLAAHPESAQKIVDAERQHRIEGAVKMQINNEASKRIWPILETEIVKEALNTLAKNGSTPITSSWLEEHMDLAAFLASDGFGEYLAEHPEDVKLVMQSEEKANVAYQNYKYYLELQGYSLPVNMKGVTVEEAREFVTNTDTYTSGLAPIEIEQEMEGIIGSKDPLFEKQWKIPGLAMLQGQYKEDIENNAEITKEWFNENFKQYAYNHIKTYLAYLQYMEIKETLMPTVIGTKEDENNHRDPENTENKQFSV